ncbi:type VII secretion protein EssC [Listeria seeligeri]
MNHINQYQKLFKQGKATEPMPHLFLISDEFAELKSEQPEFMKELVSTARIGRSLGIHLILATQKPSGVVDDQIWSNSKFKLALKVQNASDSNEILKTPDAAEITLPGRSYLQVGNNEIYELFQSAWSGADYVPDKESTDNIDTTIYAINDLGQYDILTEDLSGLDKKDDLTKLPSELDAVIDHIHEYTEAAGIEALPRPWLPPLPEQIFAEDLHPVNFEEAWKEPKKPLQATIGLLDQPELQAQVPLTLDLTKDGHVAVFSSPGFGKSTFLQSLVMDLARQHNPEQLHVYLLDFGTNGLLPLIDLPHVADTIMVDEVEKARKFAKIIIREIKARKKMLSEYRVANIEQYSKASQKNVANILVCLDNYDALREAGFGDEFDKTMIQMAREGAALGIYLVTSASKQSSIRMQVLSSIKTQVALYLIDKSEVTSIVGRTDLILEELYGRGMVKVGSQAIFQASLPTRGDDIVDQIKNMTKELALMKSKWNGELPESIPIMPEILHIEDFVNRKTTKESIENQILPLGLEYENIESIGLDFKMKQNLLIVSDSNIKINLVQKSIVKSTKAVSSSYQLLILDKVSQPLKEIAGLADGYVSEIEEHEKFDSMMEEEFKTRKDLVNRKMLKEIEGWIILITDLAEFIQHSSITIERMKEFIENGPSLNIFFIVSGMQTSIEYGLNPIEKYVKTAIRTGLVAMKNADQGIFKGNYISNEQPLEKFETYFYIDSTRQKIRLPN